MKTINIVVIVLAFALGVFIGAGGFAKLSSISDLKSANERARLKNQIKKHEYKIDSLQKAVKIVLPKLEAIHDTVKTQTIKYYEIKPIGRSYPYLDSMFRARYN